VQPVVHGTSSAQSVTLDVGTPADPLIRTLVEVDLLAEDGATVFRTNQATDAHGRIAFSLSPQLAQQPALAFAVMRASSVRIQLKQGRACTAPLGHRR
jgi:hypothetical protein